VKTLLSKRSLDNPYTGGLSSFGLVLLITRYLQHVNVLRTQQGAAASGLGELLAGFLDFVGNQFDPRATGISIGIEMPQTASSSTSAIAARQLGGRFLRRDQPLTASVPEEAERELHAHGTLPAFPRSNSSTAKRSSATQAPPPVSSANNTNNSTENLDSLTPQEASLVQSLCACDASLVPRH